VVWHYGAPVWLLFLPEDHVTASLMIKNISDLAQRSHDLAS
jgi:hypothetical protein